MIIYQETKKGFLRDLLTNDIDNIIARLIKQKTGKSIAINELAIYRQSLGHMGMLMGDDDIPDDCSVMIEYHFPHTAMRADFIITGSDGEKECVLIIELKAWTEANLTDKDGIVETRYRGCLTPASHPSYQAWSYAALLQFYSATVEKEGIVVQPCVYMHNYEEDNIIGNPFYSYYTEKAPVFFKRDALKLQAFIKKYIKSGDTTNIITKIESGEIRPNKHLADAVKSLMKGNREFILIDEQKVVYETAVNLALHSHERNKNVIIVEGGPGTGKSVVAINILATLLGKGRLAKYVSKTKAPRDVCLHNLRGDKPMVELKSLFVSSGSFTITPPNSINVLVVDEAHRITERTGQYKSGDNQLKEIIGAANCSIFFIDEDQRVHIDDYANIQRIEEFAKNAGATIHRFELASQFRCNGSDGFLAWIDNLLEIKETANYTFDAIDFNYEFKVVDTPTELYRIISEKNKINNKSRLAAGYCWDWKSNRNPAEYDIIMPEHDFKMKWNFSKYNTSWSLDPNSINQVGCIHTIQGMDMDYVGVIIGEDLIVRDGQLMVDPSKRSKEDRSISGYKKMMKENPEEAKKLMRIIIKNTYRALMTRGMKGCYVYCVNQELKNYILERLRRGGMA